MLYKDTHSKTNGNLSRIMGKSRPDCRYSSPRRVRGNVQKGNRHLEYSNPKVLSIQYEQQLLETIEVTVTERMRSWVK